MLSKYNRNGVITGPLDSYCLICESYLKSENEMAAHLEKPIHVKNLDSTPYFEKYKDDHVRKLKMGYYCEFCNLLFSTAAKIGVHLTDAKHIYNKGTKLLKRTTHGVVAYKNILINNKAWNSISDGTCSLCNEEFESESIHKSSTNHIINLIKNHVEFVDNSVYRKIDGETFHCLTCDELYALNTFTAHFKDPDHQAKYQKCRDLGNELISEAESNNIKMTTTIEQKTKKGTAVAVNNKTIKKTNTEVANKKAVKSITEEPKVPFIQRNDSVDQSKDTKDDNRSKILDSVSEIQKNHITVKFDSSTAFCKKCSMALDFDYDSIESHIEQHKKEENNKDVKHTPVKFTAYDNKQEMDGKSQSLYTKPVFLKRNETANESDMTGSSVSSKYDEEIVQFAKKHNLIYSNDKVYCPCCKTPLSASIKSLKEHIDGAKHKNTLKHIGVVATSKIRELKKVPTQQFVQSFVVMENLFSQFVVINENFCLNLFSFLTINEQSGRMKCETCNEVFHRSAMNLHKNSKKHSETLDKLKVIVSLDSEFVREVRPDLFHCGFCNNTEPGWGAMEKHLASNQHRENKRAAETCLHVVMPDIKQHLEKEKKMFSLFQFLHMLSSLEKDDSD